MKKPLIWFLAAAAVLFAAACICLWLFPQAGSKEYYVQIDNTHIEQGGPRGGVIDLTGGMPYYYTLSACDKNGRQKEIRFGANRQLREGAFLCLTVSPVRGVIEWAEVQYSDLPAAVQACFTPPADG